MATKRTTNGNGKGYRTHTQAKRENPRYRELTEAAHTLSSVLQDIEYDTRRGWIRSPEGAMRVIESRIEDLWRQAREVLAEEERRGSLHVIASSIDVPGWNGAGSDVDGKDMEANRG